MAKRLWCFLSNETLPLASPTAHTFLARLLKIGSVANTSRTGFLARYVLDLSLLEYGMQWCSASVLAATALYVGMSHGGTSPQIAWPTALEQHTGLSEECLHTCAAELRKLRKRAVASAARVVDGADVDLAALARGPNQVGDLFDDVVV